MNRYIHSYHTLNMPMYKKILNAIDSVRDDYMDRHSKVFAMRIDIRLPDGTDQKKIMKFNHRFIEAEKNKGYDPAYIMAREVSDNGKTHYHMALLLNGQKVESTYYIFKDAEHYLEKVAGPGGSINYCNDEHQNGIMIFRDDPDSGNLRDVQRQFSYLAKIKGKGNVKGKTKTFFSSRIKKKKMD